MAINFIPNDPKTIKAIPMRVTSPRPDRPANRARFSFDMVAPENVYKPGTPEFLYWQCREGAIAAVEAWEVIHGPLTSWQGGQVLQVWPDSPDEDLNAYYDRASGSNPDSLSFFHHRFGSKTCHTGASTDVVAHEVGHGLLDSIRPDLWDSTRFEVNSFHEAFGDCVAIITALQDKISRAAVLPSISSKNAIESWAEDMAAACAVSFPGDNSAAPRLSRNTFQWGPQGSIPTTGGPGALIYEEHSFAQIFSGCFYDVILNIFKGMSSQSAANLGKASVIAGSLLVKASLQVPQRSQFFREVGRLMVLIDEQENNAANRSAIQEAFSGHNISLGASAALAPQRTLGTAPRRGARSTGATSAPPDVVGGVKRRLAEILGAETTKLAISQVTLVGKQFQEALYQRAVPLSGIHEKLKGVVAMATQAALVGQSHEAMTIMGHVSNADVTISDVQSYVESLVKFGRISFTNASSNRSRGGRRSASSKASRNILPPDVTHEISEVRGQKILRRIRFSCRGV